MNPNGSSDGTGSILDTIKEQTTNLERMVTNTNLDTSLAEAIRELAPKEKLTREATIAIENNQELGFDQITKIIESEWVTSKGQAPVTFWKDKSHTYAQFLNSSIKEVFIEYAKGKEPLRKMTEKMIQPNSEGHHMTRKEVRIIMNGVPEEVQPDKLETTLKKLADPKARITAIRAGKVYGQNRKVRSLMTSVNADGFRLLFKGLSGAIPYNDNKLKIRVHPKISCKPWSCRDCFYIGPNHSCQGKACGQCGNQGHITKDCKAKTRYCTNCRKQGHRARDAHCPAYVKEIIKELKRMDIPVEYLENKNKRAELLKNLAFK